MKSTPSKKYPTIGCCGIDCGLCPRYYTSGSSRCPGCAGPRFSEKHPSCGIVTCCVVSKHLETCAQCEECPCARIGNWDAADSFVTHRNCLSNLRMIRDEGISRFITRQRRRMGLLAELLHGFDDGRSKSFYCLSAGLLDLDELEKAVAEGKRQKATADPKMLAAWMRETLKGIAGKTGVGLSYRK